VVTLAAFGSLHPNAATMLNFQLVAAQHTSANVSGNFESILHIKDAALPGRHNIFLGMKHFNKNKLNLL